MLNLYFRWQLKYFRVATRFGLLAEACLALLLLPILRGLAIFRLLGIQFEASVRYHIWVGTAMLTFSILHGASTLFIWGVSHHIQEEVIIPFLLSISVILFTDCFSSLLFWYSNLIRIMFFRGLFLLNNRYGDGRKLGGYTLLERLVLLQG